VAATGIKIREINMNPLASGNITDVETLRFDWRRVKNGTATDVDVRVVGYGKEK
jgi:hypothetical protein